MIVVRLNGGLGNQLFQYATARCLAIKHSTDLYLDLSIYKNASRLDTPRNFELDSCNHVGKRFPPINYFVNRSLKYFPFFFQIIFKKNIIFERGLNFNIKFNDVKDNSYLIGYWQSYKYFIGIEPQIMDEFSLKISLSNESERILEVIKGECNSVGVHIRRGDYLSNPSAINFHGVLSVEYYRETLDYIRNNIQNPSVFIFSDDVEWCKNNLELNSDNIFYVEHKESISPWEDLNLMSYCKNHIIANSSFSWWGAWMADQRFGIDRIVLAPKSWFKGAVINVNDRYPSHWILV